MPNKEPIELTRDMESVLKLKAARISALAELVADQQAQIEQLREACSLLQAKLQENSKSEPPQLAEVEP